MRAELGGTDTNLPVVDVPWQADTPNDIGVLKTLADPIWVRLAIAPVPLAGAWGARVVAATTPRSQ